MKILQSCLKRNILKYNQNCQLGKTFHTPTTNSNNSNNWQIAVIGPFEGALSGLAQFLATESPLKRMKNVFYFTLKVLLVLKILVLIVLTFWLCGKTA